jgi:hypothetical protein
MTTATVDRPVIHVAEMSRTEAEEITSAIKNNFDSLGFMILQARDRKAYKALGYRSFDTYCKTEFGKSVSSAYQLIEDTKVVAELEVEISKQSDEPVSLNFPSSHLRPLKEIPGIADKLKAIKYAQKLAEAEGKRATKKHLEIAVFEISGKRSKDFKSAIESLGFTKGVQVEVIKNLKKDRGFVKKVDKGGKIHVQLHDGGNIPTLCDANDLRILGDTEKPAIPASDDTVNKGDKVKIFARGREGQTGEIFTWQMGRHAMVKVDGEKVPVNIAYAELELLTDIQSNLNDWESDLKWSTTNNNYFFNSESDTIICDKWPAGLVLHPHHSELGPIDWMDKWENIHALGLLKSLFNSSQLKTLAVAQAIRLPEEEKREFITDLIAGMVRLLPSQFKLGASSNTPDTEALKAENQRLREQLAEAESAIEAIVGMAHEQIQSLPEAEETTEFLVEDAASIVSPLGAKETTEFLVEDAASTPSPLGADESWLSVLESNDFTQDGIQLNGEPTEVYRGWDIYDYNSSVMDIFHPNKGTFSIDFSWCREKQIIKPLEWLKNIINQVEDFCPGQLSLDLNPEIVSSEIINSDTEFPQGITGYEQAVECSVKDAALSEAEIESFPQEMIDRVASEREKIFQAIEAIEVEKTGKLNKAERDRVYKGLQSLSLRLEGLKKFEQLRVAQIVWYKNQPGISGEITGFAFTTGGMPHVFVRWNSESEDSSNISTEIVSGILTSDTVW